MIFKEDFQMSILLKQIEFNFKHYGTYADADVDPVQIRMGFRCCRMIFKKSVIFRPVELQPSMIAGKMSVMYNLIIMEDYNWDRRYYTREIDYLRGKQTHFTRDVDYVWLTMDEIEELSDENNVNRYDLLKELTNVTSKPELLPSDIEFIYTKGGK